MGRRLANTAHKQRYPEDSKSAQLHEGKFIKLKTFVKPRTYGQEFYLNCLNECDITIATGPAGCGKTWLVTHFALQKLLDNEVEKIIVTKPILEAGSEKLGALPGEVEDKIGPHFQSILDCFEDHLGPTMTKALIEREKIVFLPTAYCRGRDIKHAFILIDEAQNLTRKGIKLLMTRISEGSKMAINGDSDQIDLPNEKDSGLAWAMEKLAGKDPSIGMVELRENDIQRHNLIRVVLTHLR
jgi:phosphate starvation-inducible PhoH-like protein